MGRVSAGGKAPDHTRFVLYMINPLIPSGQNKYRDVRAGLDGAFVCVCSVCASGARLWERGAHTRSWVLYVN